MWRDILMFIGGLIAIFLVSRFVFNDSDADTQELMSSASAKAIDVSGQNSKVQARRYAGKAGLAGNIVDGIQRAEEEKFQAEIDNSIGVSVNSTVKLTEFKRSRVETCQKIISLLPSTNIENVIQKKIRSDYTETSGEVAMLLNELSRLNAKISNCVASPQECNSPVAGFGSRSFISRIEKKLASGNLDQSSSNQFFGLIVADIQTTYKECE